MTDLDLLAKRLSLIETCIADLRRLARLDLMPNDVREERFVHHTLQIAIQSAIDVALHIIADNKLGEPESSSDAFRALARAGWVDGTLTTELVRMAGFRNILVHGYQRVDPGVVRDVVEHRLSDLLAFVATIRARSGLPGA